MHDRLTSSYIPIADEHTHIIQDLRKERESDSKSGGFFSKLEDKINSATKQGTDVSVLCLLAILLFSSKPRGTLLLGSWPLPAWILFWLGRSPPCVPCASCHDDPGQALDKASKSLDKGIDKASAKAKEAEVCCWLVAFGEKRLAG